MSGDPKPTPALTLEELALVARWIHPQDCRCRGCLGINALLTAAQEAVREARVEERRRCAEMLREMSGPHHPDHQYVTLAVVRQWADSIEWRERRTELEKRGGKI